MLLFRSAPRRLMDSLMGFAGGVMAAPAAWSLLQPAMERGGVLPAAGAMLYVVVEELILETEGGGNIDVATLGFIGGFTVMMAMDNAPG